MYSTVRILPACKLGFWLVTGISSTSKLPNLVLRGSSKVRPRFLFWFLFLSRCRRMRHRRLRSHKTSLLINYYTKKQHAFYKNIINANFTLDQNRDTKYIPLPLIISLAYILTNECNPKNDIKIDTYTIQI